MEGKSVDQALRDKLYSAAKIDKVISEIEVFSSNNQYMDFTYFECIKDIPLEDSERIDRIIQKKERCRNVYATLMSEIVDDLLDLSEDIFEGRELFRSTNIESSDEESGVSCDMLQEDSDDEEF